MRGYGGAKNSRINVIKKKKRLSGGSIYDQEYRGLLAEVVRGILARGNLEDTANIKCQKTLIT